MQEESCAGKGRKIGVFGGTFDPVHEGHLLLAKFILEQKLVDCILFLPAACPPHKSGAIASFTARVAMLETAIADNPAMAVSVLESRRTGPSYTVDSLGLLQGEFPGSRLFFILGADSLLELHLWYRFADLFILAELLVVARAGLADEQCYAALQRLPGMFVPDASMRIWKRRDGARVWYLTGFSSSVSSSGLRKQLRSNVRPQGISPRVLSFIYKNELYS